MEKKLTSPKETRGQYLKHSMEEMALGGDAYTFADSLYHFCVGKRKQLSMETFHADKGYLLRKGILHQEGQRLYLTKTWRYETAAAEALASILRANQLEAPALPETLEVGGLTLNAEQKEAVRMALSHRLSIILGGAGTGKTSLIQALVRHRIRYLPNWVLCAPTGKAARNLTERSGMQARTVHSALGKSPDEDFLAPVAWYFTGLLVVDEASMMTLEMLAGILSIAPSGCRIVLVGDPHQLLSVGSGNVLPDLLALGVPCTKLEVCHRQEDESGVLLRNVREFKSCRCLNDFLFDDNFTFLQMDDEKEVKRYVCEEGARRYLAGERVQVLSPFNRSGELSVWQLNRAIRTLVNPPEKASGSLTLAEESFYDGDRVMVTENDWERRICNGDIGTLRILPMQNKVPRYGFLSGDRIVMWDNWDGLRMLTLALAITVHKAQGSEYDTVILPVTKQFSNLLHRNLLYTAISRARKQVILVGDADALDIALQHEPPVRRSMLVSKTRMLLRESA